MTTSEGSAGAPSRRALSGRAQQVRVDDDALVIELEDGRQLAVPLTWFPRLLAATPDERSRWELVGRGIGIAWPDIDEDISVDNLLGSGHELLFADFGLQVGMLPTAQEIVRGWSGADEQLVERLCQGGFFNERQTAERFIRRTRAEDAAKTPSSTSGQPTGPLSPAP